MSGIHPPAPYLPRNDPPQEEAALLSAIIATQQEVATSCLAMDSLMRLISERAQTLTR